MKLNFEKSGGLIPIVVQDHLTKEVLMMAYMNEEAWEKTVSTGIAHYYSRSRDKIWKKGEESGNTQIVKNIFIDCDEDTVLLLVQQNGGAACHKGYESCFFRELESGELKIRGKRVFDPEKVYKKDK